MTEQTVPVAGARERNGLGQLFVGKLYRLAALSECNIPIGIRSRSEPVLDQATHRQQRDVIGVSLRLVPKELIGLGIITIVLVIR